MFFLNLAFGQFLIAAGAISAFTVALYLLDRSRRRQVVSTLRFWTQASQPVQTSRRRMIRQPLSLLLQLAGILLLMLAIAQPRIGNPFSRPRSHVLLLDTSSWMAAHAGSGALIDIARRRALQWLAAIPAADRVMLVRADGMATPATAFEGDHSRVRAAILASEPGATALDLSSAIRFARRAQAMQHASGEVVYVGSGKVRTSPDASVEEGSGIRFLNVAEHIENVGLRRADVARSAAGGDTWDALITVKNYGLNPRQVTLSVGFDRAPVGLRQFVLAPGAEQENSFSLHASQAGLLEIRVTPEDDFPDDNRAEILIPTAPHLKLTVYTAHAETVRPLLAATGVIDAQFRPLTRGGTDGKEPPDADTIWINPPAEESPLPVLKTIREPRGIRWTPLLGLGAGLRARDVRLGPASLFATRPGDISVASVDEGAIIVARPGAKKMAVVGFDPAGQSARYQLATPLVFANILRWIDPQAFQQNGVALQSAGSVSVDLNAAGMESTGVEVKSADGAPLPFTTDGHTLRFFSGARNNLKVVTPGRELDYALTLPEMWDTRWVPPAGVLRGLPRGAAASAAPAEIWPWLAILGVGCLAAEWILYSRQRRALLRAVPAAPPMRRVS